MQLSGTLGIQRFNAGMFNSHYPRWRDALAEPRLDAHGRIARLLNPVQLSMSIIRVLRIFQRVIAVAVKNIPAGPGRDAAGGNFRAAGRNDLQIQTMLSRA